MIKISQTRFGEGKGNCFTACVCCILDIEDVESVPNFCLIEGNWWETFQKWIIENTSFEAKFYDVSMEEEHKLLNGKWDSLNIKPPFILSGLTDEGGHAVLYCPDGTIWNTNTSQVELYYIQYITYFIPRKDLK